MSGKYGNMLTAWPELFQTVEFFEAVSDENGAWRTTGLMGKHRVILYPIGYNGPADKRVTGNSLGGGVDAGSYLEKSDKDLLYAPFSINLECGWFFLYPVYRTVYRIVRAIDFNMIGGFKCWEVERVQGSRPDFTIPPPPLPTKAPEWR